jgi:hypothetical protein
LHAQEVADEKGAIYLANIRVCADINLVFDPPVVAVVGEHALADDIVEVIPNTKIICLILPTMH